MRHKLLLTISILAIILPIGVWAWVEPTTIPPGNNIFAPINSSAFGQSKIGGLILNIGNAAHGLIVRYGLVGIGTDDPQATLDVAGKVRSTSLEVNSTTEGVLFPRMTTAQRDAITNKVEGLLIYNIDSDSKQLEIYTDGAWKSIGGGDSLPNGTIAFFNLSSCPDGWVEKTALKGRYPVGLPNSGTLGQSVGTALTNGENRSVGQHNHVATQEPHSHLYDKGVSQRLIWDWYGSPVKYIWGEETPTSAVAPLIKVENSGSVVGTNAPYLQLLACEKQTEGGSSSGSGSSTSCTVCQISKMTTAERDSLSNPEAGLEIFNTDTGTKNLFNGVEWTEIVSLVPGLAGRWNLNETFGSVVADSSGRGNTGSSIGTTIVDGKVSKARSFNGSSERILISDNSNLRPTNITMEAWIYPIEVYSERYVIYKSTSGVGNGYSLGTYQNTIQGRAGGAVGSGDCYIGASISTNSWHHIVYTYDDSSKTCKLYANGTVVATGTTALSAIMTSTVPLAIGSRSDQNAHYFQGLIDEVKIYNIARTAEQIKADYEATK